MVSTPVYAYVLHRRPYKETSLLVDLWTLELGRLRCVVNGARVLHKNKQQTEPFCRYLLQISGRGELKNGRHFEALRRFTVPMGVATYSAMYLNELIMRSEPLFQPNVDIFAAYEWALTQLQTTDTIAPVLRHVEMLILTEHGYGIDFSRDSAGLAVTAQCSYQFIAERGFVECHHESDAAVSGSTLLSLHDNAYQNIHQTALAAICRQALLPLVGDEPFQSRQLFKRFRPREWSAE